MMLHTQMLNLIDNIYDGIALSFGAPTEKKASENLKHEALHLSVEALEEVARTELSVNGEQPLDDLLPHLRRAVHIRWLLNSLANEQMWLSALLDVRTEAIFLLESDQKITFANAAAETLLGEKTVLHVRNERLQPLDRNCATKFSHRIASMQSSMRHTTLNGCFVFTQKDEDPLPALLTKVAAGAAGNRLSQQGILVLVRGPSKGPSAELLRECYDFSATETKIALELVACLSVDETAEKLGIMSSTVRTHLKSIFAKTKTSRQSELIVKLLRLPVL